MCRVFVRFQTKFIREQKYHNNQETTKATIMKYPPKDLNIIVVNSDFIFVDTHSFGIYYHNLVETKNMQVRIEIEYQIKCVNVFKY